jgi:CSLREA domain-containing protein
VNLNERFIAACAQFRRSPTMRNVKLRQALFAGFLVAPLALLVAPAAAFAGTFVVTKTADTADGACDANCSLREAIIASNANAVPDTIRLGPGVYPLSRYGPWEDAAETGDLDILADPTPIGTGAAQSIIDGLGNGG